MCVCVLVLTVTGGEEEEEEKDVCAWLRAPSIRVREK